MTTRLYVQPKTTNGTMVTQYTPLRTGKAPSVLSDGETERKVAHSYSNVAVHAPVDAEGDEPEEEGILFDQDGGIPDAGVPLPGGVPAAPSPAPAAPPPLSVTVPTHIQSPSSPAGTPDRIPPRVDTDVAVTVSGWRIPMSPVELSIEGGGGGNGTATINGGATASLMGSETVHLRGVDQTTPGNAGNLRLVAKQGGTTLARSAGFTVAAIPQNFSISFNAPITGARRGIRVNNSWESDSGNLADLDEAERSEQVEYGAGSGIFAGVTGHNSGYLPADNSPLVDSHGVSAAAITGAGSLTAEQVFIYKDKRTDVKDIPVKNSGFRISRTATPNPAAGNIDFTTAKAGTSTTANGFSSSAGAGSVSLTQVV